MDHDDGRHHESERTTVEGADAQRRAQHGSGAIRHRLQAGNSHRAAQQRGRLGPRGSVHHAAAGDQPVPGPLRHQRAGHRPDQYVHLHGDHGVHQQVHPDDGLRGLLGHGGLRQAADQRSRPDGAETFGQQPLRERTHQQGRDEQRGNDRIRGGRSRHLYRPGFRPHRAVGQSPGLRAGGARARGRRNADGAGLRRQPRPRQHDDGRGRRVHGDDDRRLSDPRAGAAKHDGFHGLYLHGGHRPVDLHAARGGRRHDQGLPDHGDEHGRCGHPVGERGRV